MVPVVRLASAPPPSAVLLLPKSPSVSARTVGESPKQASASVTRRSVRRRGERLIDFINGGVVVWRLNISLFIAVIFFFPVVNPAIAGLKEEKKPSGRSGPSPDSDLCSDAELG